MKKMVCVLCILVCHSLAFSGELELELKQNWELFTVADTKGNIRITFGIFEGNEKEGLPNNFYGFSVYRRIKKSGTPWELLTPAYVKPELTSENISKHSDYLDSNLKKYNTQYTIRQYLKKYLESEDISNELVYKFLRKDLTDKQRDTLTFFYTPMPWNPKLASLLGLFYYDTEVEHGKTYEYAAALVVKDGDELKELPAFARSTVKAEFENLTMPPVVKHEIVYHPGGRTVDIYFAFEKEKLGGRYWYSMCVVAGELEKPLPLGNVVQRNFRHDKGKSTDQLAWYRVSISKEKLPGKLKELCKIGFYRVNGYMEPCTLYGPFIIPAEGGKPGELKAQGKVTGVPVEKRGK